MTVLLSPRQESEEKRRFHRHAQCSTQEHTDHETVPESHLLLMVISLASTAFWLANQTGEEETQSADASAKG